MREVRVKNEQQPTVFVVDDDEAMRESMRWLLDSVKLPVETYPSAQSFLDGYPRDHPGCLVLDVRMPEMSGTELQARLKDYNITLPVIMVSGHGDLELAVKTVREGAIDFIPKPYSDDKLLERVQKALASDSRARSEKAATDVIVNRIDSLTPRERQVMERVAAGQSNKVIALELGVSAKTVEAHRAKVMDKMEVDSLAQLVRLVVASGLYSEVDLETIGGNG